MIYIRKLWFYKIFFLKIANFLLLKADLPKIKNAPEGVKIYFKYFGNISDFSNTHKSRKN